jgi:drug/metabolite transporter (DMT)-like permease|tara:strand:+ start:3414 stop:4295 length:882 start_codon:yes stop_codon:yes gene_type:complete
MKNNSSLYAWSLLILLSLIWGISPILIKKSLISLNPFEVGALRLTFASISLLPFIFYNIREVRKKDYLILLISGIVGNLLPYFLYPIAQTQIDSNTSGVLTSLTPFFALIIGIFFYNQRATKNNLIGLLIGFLGTVTLILFSSETQSLQGNIFGLFVVLATLLYGINLNLIKHYLNHLKPITTTSFSIVSILPFALYVLFYQTPFIEHIKDFEQHKNQFLYVLTLGVLSTSMATIIFYNIIKIKDTVFASMVTYLMPVVAISIGFFDGEVINAIQGVGIILIISGVFISSKKN